MATKGGEEGIDQRFDEEAVYLEEGAAADPVGESAGGVGEAGGSPGGTGEAAAEAAAEFGVDLGAGADELGQGVVEVLAEGLEGGGIAVDGFDVAQEEEVSWRRD